MRPVARSIVANSTLPSALNVGSLYELLSVVSRLGSPPAAGTIHNDWMVSANAASLRLVVAANTTELPSGDQAAAMESPPEPHWPAKPREATRFEPARISAAFAPVSSGWTKRLGRRSSSQRSQSRMGNASYTRAFHFRLRCSSAAFLLSSSDFAPGYTSLVNRIAVPSGRHRGVRAPVETLVIRSASPGCPTSM